MTVLGRQASPVEVERTIDGADAATAYCRLQNITAAQHSWLIEGRAHRNVGVLIVAPYEALGGSVVYLVPTTLQRALQRAKVEALKFFGVRIALEQQQHAFRRVEIASASLEYGAIQFTQAATPVRQGLEAAQDIGREQRRCQVSERRIDLYIHYARVPEAFG